jgi:ribonucleotide monophosphatase NagD (HAD superfamily)
MVAVDFDGTIFDGFNVFPGCVEKLTELRERYWIAIFSARQTDTERIQMKAILDSNGVPYDEILERKPNAVAFIDDKGIRFEGSWDKVLTYL